VGQRIELAYGVEQSGASGYMYSSNKRLTGMALTPTIFGHEKRVCPVVLRDTGQCNGGKDVTTRSTSHIRRTMCDVARDRQRGLGQELMWDLCLLPARGTDVLTAFCKPILATQDEGHQVRCGLPGGVQSYSSRWPSRCSVDRPRGPGTSASRGLATSYQSTANDP
jgi:hypothetical protein